MTRSRVRFAAPAAILGAGATFWMLAHGGALGGISVRGYAEDLDAPAAPVAAGRVARVLVEVGQATHTGDVVAVMDTTELEFKLANARLAFSRANTQLGAGEFKAGAAVARAELLVLRTEATLTRDRAELTEVQQQLVRLEKLASDQLVQARTVEQEKLKEADLKASVELLDAATKQRRAGLGRKQGGQAAVDEVEVQLAPLRDAVHVAETSVKLAQLAYDEATVRAHADGVVSAILHHAGDVVPAGTELVRIVSGRPGRVVCWVPERDLGKVVVGRGVHLRGQGLWAARWSGRVAVVAPEIEEVPVRARLAPQVPAWGRRVELETWPPQPFVLGEVVHVRF